MDVIQQTDSTAAHTAAVVADSVKNEPAKDVVPHPYEVLRQLPPDATPAQQDSAIQAVFHVENTHLSTRPDTLTLPGQEEWISPRDINLPQYYRETFFSKDSLFYSEMSGGRYGVAGDPVPYTIRGDNTMTALLICCFIIAMIALANTRGFLMRQVRHFFREPSGNTTEMTETTAEVRFQLFLTAQTCLLLALLQYSYTTNFIATTFTLASPYQLMGIFLGAFAAYFAAKALLYTAVNLTFFSRRANRQWLKSQLFITSAEGVMLFPVVLLMVYFDMPARSVAYSVAFVLIIVKILTFHKCHAIFFKHKNGFLQIILYFCALEIVPLAALWGALVETGNHLKINI